MINNIRALAQKEKKIKTIKHRVIIFALQIFYNEKAITDGS